MVLGRRHQVCQSDLARFLLDRSLSEIESGQLEIPTKVPNGRFFDVKINLGLAMAVGFLMLKWSVFRLTKT